MFKNFISHTIIIILHRIFVFYIVLLLLLIINYIYKYIIDNSRLFNTYNDKEYK